MLSASILITTKDRAEIFSRSLDSAMSQVAVDEIVVIDDGSSDDSSRVASKNCRDVVLVRNDEAKGIIAARNQGLALATKEIVFTLDDDAIFSGPEVVKRVLEQFDRECIGSVTIPLIDHFADGKTRQRLPIESATEDFLCVPQFSGGANAIRRELFLEHGGYGGNFRQGEERGLCLKLLDSGYITRVAAEVHIDHFPQAMVGGREEISYWNIRNSIEFGRQMPLPDRFVHNIGTIGKHWFSGLQMGQSGQVLRGAYDEFFRTKREPHESRKVKHRTLRAFRKLSGLRVFRFSELKRVLERYRVAIKE